MILTNCSFSILLSHVHIYMCSGDFIEDGEENMQQIIYAYISVSVIMNIYIIYIYFISMYLYITWHSHCIHELMETMIICTRLVHDQASQCSITNGRGAHEAPPPSCGVITWAAGIGRGCFSSEMETLGKFSIAIPLSCKGLKIFLS